MLWSRDSDLELFVAFYDKEGVPVSVTENWLTLEIKVGRALFKADSNPLVDVEGEDGEITHGKFENCYIAEHEGDEGLMVVIPPLSLDFGTVYMRSCVHEPNEHFPDGYKDVWNVWLPIDLAIVTEKGLNQ